MKFNRNARLDSSEVRTKGRGGAAVGGGVGIIGVVVILAMQFLGGGGGDLTEVLSGLDGQQAGGGPTAEIEGCETGADAAERQDCRIVAFVNSIQDHWTTRLEGYQPAVTNFFSGSVTTGGCGSASSAVGPFYCPADSQVYIDLGFFETLETRFGASGGDFAEAYVLAHEYGHHVQNLLGIRGDRDEGADSDAVRQELQADCFAGTWANSATTTPDPTTGEILILELTRADIDEALSAAAAVGDDRIQESATGQVDPESWTHGSAEQRQRWFLTGYESGDPNDCDTFAATTL
ncbi:KPN_02809 family neutral zinc metallopeptidase [Actinospongicola halichondriae]|uniref:KPN_02809 family neutral zinc metallopeptidase n=1 Tax=Actinospongicola halichondriae TaxID=3236844 RepID=UPI003D4891BD